MAEDTHISWANDTFNPWIGCMKVGPACDGCYAEALMGVPGRFGPARVEWGAPGVGVGTRSRTAPANWAKVRKWDREQEAKEKAWARGFPCVPPPAPRFVFCASLADVFDNHPDLALWRRDLFALIRETPHLTWLLLTKRPGMIVKLFAETLTAEVRHELSKTVGLGESLWPKNAAIGFTAVNQLEMDRDSRHALAAFHGLNPAFLFWSGEPLLGPVVIPEELLELGRRFWAITGGETDQGSHKARPQHPQWFRSPRDQCAAAGVPYHHKQNGEWVSVSMIEGRGGEPVHMFDDGSAVRRVGKDRSGRLIDGQLHDARPEVTQ